MKLTKFTFLGLAALLTITLSAQQPKNITVVSTKPTAEVQPTMWGVFFEDINFAADGGLYAEMIKNRSFEFSLPMMGWRAQGRQNGTGRTVPTFYTPRNSANPRYLSIFIDPEVGSFSLNNEGFRGMGIKENDTYNFSVSAKIPAGSDIKMKIEFVTPRGNEVLGSADLTGFTQSWKSYKVSFKATQTEPKAQFRITLTGKGSIDLDMVSLFPADTWKGREGGLRRDLVEVLAELKPGFLRFPGGCIVEGRDLANRYQWKTSVGPIDQRTLIMNRWNVEIRNRQAPDYFQTFGLGFYEYFLLAEDLGAEPLPILNCGMSCQFNAGEVVPLEELDEYIQDALDLIEFANGPLTSKWGALRASMGHPKPFNMKYIGVGNEQWDPQYIERYIEFEKVLKAKHPEILVVSGSGPSASGQRFDYLWGELKNLNPDIVDEHYYMPPEWFLSNANRYDSYDRKGPKIFAGEYAAHGPEGEASESRNTWLSALAEAAYMTGLERNADIVHLVSYAPLMAHVEAWQWRPDLIWFDNLNVVKTPNYHVQKFFSNHAGTHIIPIHEAGKPLIGQDSIYASATLDRRAGTIHIKLVNAAPEARAIRLNLDNNNFERTGTMQTLRGENMMDFNSISQPELIKPVTSQIAFANRRADLTLQPGSVNVITLKIRK
jgi:alpha-L-arabinofuranosidase